MTESKKSGMWPEMCHLGMLLGMLVPLGNLLGPLGIWLWKRKSDPEIDYHGRESLNFQLSLTLYTFVLLIVFIPVFGFSLIDPSLEKMRLGMGALALLVVPILVISVGSLILVIIAAIKANSGIRYRYPLTLRFIKAPVPQ